MKKKIILSFFLMLCFCSGKIIAQYPVGHQTLTYVDPSRSSRSVTTETYYPATSAGESTPFANGQFPLIVFGHGFVMGYDAYAYFKDNIVPFGYIIVFCTTESSMSPVHSDFGLDLAFLDDTIKNESASNPSSPFYNKVASTSAIMGHSMGAGSSFLACENNTVPTCMVTFAAAETTPSAITAAKNVTIPALVLSGSLDCVADPATNQVPMYDSLSSACKVYISITEGSHCYFADYNFNCTLGEQTCHPGSYNITRADQEDATLDFVKLYIDYYLKGNAASWDTFVDSLNASPRITYQMDCPVTAINEVEKNPVSVWPNPANDKLNISFTEKGTYTFSISDLSGKIILSQHQTSAQGISFNYIDISGLSKGMYLLQLSFDSYSVFKKFIKN